MWRKRPEFHQNNGIFFRRRQEVTDATIPMLPTINQNWIEIQVGIP